MVGSRAELAAVTGTTRERPAAGRLGSLARGGAANLVGALVAAVANLLLVVVITRNFPAVFAGTFFAVTSVFLLAAVIAKLGTQTGLVYFLSRARALGQLDRMRAIIAVGTTPVAVVSVICAVTLFAFAPAIASVAVQSHQAEFTTLLRSLAPFLPAAALTDTLLAATRGFGSMAATVRIEKILRSVLQLLLVLLVAAYATGPSLGLAWAAPYLVAAGAAAWAARSAVRSARSRAAGPADAGTEEALIPATAAPDGGTVRGFWTFTWPRTVSSLAQFALQRLDVLMVAALRGPAEAAVYTAATRFLVVGQLGAQAISSAAQPQLGEALARDDRALANSLYRTATAWLMLLSWPIYLLSAAFAPLLLGIFGEGYSSGAVVVVVLALAMLVATGCGMVDMLLTMGGRTSWNLVNTLLALAVNVGLNLLLIPSLGILGAAVAWAAAILVNNLLPLAQIGLVLRLHPFDRSTGRAALLAVACFGLVPGALLLVPVPVPMALTASAAVGVPLYAALCWASRDVLGLAELRGALARRGRRPTSAARAAG
ncbi:O-antigen/teichoic acid export membrane protein [Blastococcus colisei]|uniref:O-antigen/teichoic acid export membrane protein n=1 Tax=Blastococcus colisei TaxID=1564162 RepID=A0A543P0D2_9ACTN|nr:oligosaccharide flippase family protein [Blastococcus colisei]TQN37559.1 O-antigen/teichoic acid export membrane protein [Blastococcus colisei]